MYNEYILYSYMYIMFSVCTMNVIYMAGWQTDRLRLHGGTAPAMYTICTIGSEDDDDAYYSIKVKYVKVYNSIKVFNRTCVYAMHATCMARSLAVSYDVSYDVNIINIL